MAPRSFDPAAAVESFQGATARAAAKHSEISPAIFSDIGEKYARAYVDYNREMSVTLQRGQPSTSDRDALKASLMNKYFRPLQDEVIQRYGDEGKRAWNAIGNEMAGQTLLSPIIRPYYDVDKGGLRPGGIIGGLVGFAIGMFLTQGGGLGLIGLVGLLAATGLGTWAGNEAANALENHRPMPQGPQNPSLPAEDPRQARTPDQRTIAAARAASSGLASMPGGSDVDRGDSGVLPAQPAPLATAPDAGRTAVKS